MRSPFLSSLADILETNIQPLPEYRSQEQVTVLSLFCFFAPFSFSPFLTELLSATVMLMEAVVPEYEDEITDQWIENMVVLFQVGLHPLLQKRIFPDRGYRGSPAADNGPVGLDDSGLFPNETGSTVSQSRWFSTDVKILDHNNYWTTWKASFEKQLRSCSTSRTILFSAKTR